MTNKPRICLIHTGGAISMIEESGMNPISIYSEHFDLDFVYLMNKDSVDINPMDWQAKATQIFDRRNDGYRGFVVTHGTDTIVYTASALAFAFGPNLNVAIILTGAMAPPTVVHGDAKVNLLRACDLALEPLAEVCIAFGEMVIRGCNKFQ